MKITFNHGVFALSLILVIGATYMSITGIEISNFYAGLVSSVVAFWTGNQLPSYGDNSEVVDISALQEELNNLTK